MSDSLQPRGLQPARLLCPWDSPGKNTGVGCHSLPRGSSPPGDHTLVSCTAGRFFIIWATWEALFLMWMSSISFSCLIAMARNSAQHGIEVARETPLSVTQRWVSLAQGFVDVLHQVEEVLLYYCFAESTNQERILYLYHKPLLFLLRSLCNFAFFLFFNMLITLVDFWILNQPCIPWWTMN